ncbi:hypothetical protein MVEN_02520700 [Mycena venus]|uniref:Actin-like ATPase domain-containing protein n=1 Tax=Mycena venus TaxID=2733690 RepID=A0A8H6WUL6_9AGAR|nr:hypothetical protein MVEN_02520700 [Mycena venus]
MRKAAINAGLVDQAGERRVRFVTEAEAAVLYAADSGSVEDRLVDGGHLILCDCGGGTVDITSVLPQFCLFSYHDLFAASVCGGTEWDDEDRLQRVVNHFDRNAKKKFAEGDTVCYVQLDGHRTTPNLGITRGRLKITGEEMESFFFAAPLQQIKESLEIAFENGGRLADKVILVGGLASSPYMFSKFVAWGKEFGISVNRPDGPTTKAVANGALAWHLDSSFADRQVPLWKEGRKEMYGISIRRPFDATNPVHCEKGRQNGKPYIHGVWSSIVKKSIQNEKNEMSKEFARPFQFEMTADTMNFVREVTIYAYRRLVPPSLLTFPGKQTLVPGYDAVCTVKADLQYCYHATPYKTTSTGVKLKNVDVGNSSRLSH